MDKLRLYDIILRLSELQQDYSAQWFNLFGQTLEDGTQPLTVGNVINNTKFLGFLFTITILSQKIHDKNVEEYIEENSIDENKPFFDFASEVTNNGGLIRIEEPLTQANFRVKKCTSIAFVPRN